MSQIRFLAPLQKETTIKLMTQYKITYLLNVPKTSEYPAYKKYLNFLVQTMGHLE